MTKKEVIRMLAFLLVVCVMILALCELFEQENSESEDEDEDMMDDDKKCISFLSLFIG